MAKGSVAKQEIFQKLLETFKGSFMADEKTLRIPWVENGEQLEVKVALTAAKDMLGGGAVVFSAPVTSVSNSAFPEPVQKKEIRATEEEKAEVAAMLANLGL